jgi:AraC-like DNA-binding protein
MKAIPLTRSATFIPFVDFLSRGSASVPRLLGAADISPDVLSSPENLLPLQQASTFVGGAARREGVEDLGLQVGAATPIARLGLFGLALAQSLTLNDLIRKLIRLVPLLDSGARVWLVRRDASTLELRLKHDAQEGRAQIDAYALMLLISALRLAIGPTWRPQKVALDSAAVGLAHRQEALSEAAIDGKVDYVAVCIPRERLAQPMGRNHVHTTDPARTEGEFVATAPASDVVGSISQVIHGALRTGVPTIDGAAEMAGTSVRTLQRRLAANAITYEEVVNRVRFEKAVRLLGNPRIKLSSIASDLGYSDAANFTRAFRRWAGHSPSEFRQSREGSVP